MAANWKLVKSLGATSNFYPGSPVMLKRRSRNLSKSGSKFDQDEVFDDVTTFTRVNKHWCCCSCWPELVFVLTLHFKSRGSETLALTLFRIIYWASKAVLLSDDSLLRFAMPQNNYLPSKTSHFSSGISAAIWRSFRGWKSSIVLIYETKQI